MYLNSMKDWNNGLSKMLFLWLKICVHIKCIYWYSFLSLLLVHFIFISCFFYILIYFLLSVLSFEKTSCHFFYKLFLSLAFFFLIHILLLICFIYFCYCCFISNSYWHLFSLLQINWISLKIYTYQYKYGYMNVNKSPTCLYGINQMLYQIELVIISK